MVSSQNALDVFTLSTSEGVNNSNAYCGDAPLKDNYALFFALQDQLQRSMRKNEWRKIPCSLHGPKQQDVVIEIKNYVEELKKRKANDIIPHIEYYLEARLYKVSIDSDGKLVIIQVVFLCYCVILS